MANLVMTIAKPKASKETAKDLTCGVVVEKASELKSERGGRTYHFCSPACQRMFESPEAELKSMRRRVTIALTGYYSSRSCALLPSPRLPPAP